MLKFFVLLVILPITLCLSPPTFNYSYQVPFKETVIKDKVPYYANAQLFYDPINNRQRVDRDNGRHNAFCGTILRNVDSPCQSLTVNNNRWMIFPQKNLCCLCCTSQQGCGILAPDWLKGADFQGYLDIDGAKYEKWHQKGAVSQNYLYTSADDQRIARRLDQGGSQIADYNLKQFQKKNFADSVFAVPTYCNPSKPTKCPITSICWLYQRKQEAERKMIDLDQN